ncbi:MAG: hypothetical protein NTV34_19905, partial [Proteobacteria bacterium]|nr:hypothetical protein [Pseudomonadota bacterium]
MKCFFRSKRGRTRVCVLFSLSLQLLSGSCGRRSVNDESAQLLDLGDATKTEARLKKISAAIDAIKATVMINDEARLQVLNRSVTLSRDLVKSKGIANIKTVNSLRKLVMYFIYSEQFFEFIRTDRNQVDIAFLIRDILATDSDSIRVDIGYDEDPLGTILADNLDIVQQRTKELLAATELPQAV